MGEAVGLDREHALREARIIRLHSRLHVAIPCLSAHVPLTFSRLINRSPKFTISFLRPRLALAELVDPLHELFFSLHHLVERHLHPVGEPRVAGLRVLLPALELARKNAHAGQAGGLPFVVGHGAPGAGTLAAAGHGRTGMTTTLKLLYR